MKKTWGLINLFLCIYKISIDPDDTVAGFGVGEWLYKLGLTERFVSRLKSDPETAAFIRDRKKMQTYEMNDLKKLNPGTLGRTYADHMALYSLQPNFYKFISAPDDTAFCMMRLRQTHDLWHVMTGFGVSHPEELGLLAFYTALTEAPLSPFMVGGALIKAALKENAIVRPIFDNLAKGYAMGLKARQMFALDWENNWKTPLEDLRKKYHIKALPNLEQNLLKDLDQLSLRRYKHIAAET